MALGNTLLAGRSRKALLLWLCFYFSSAPLFLQDQEINFNTTYRFPLSIGAEWVHTPSCDNIPL
jgi:hypothetical protein